MADKMNGKQEKHQWIGRREDLTKRIPPVNGNKPTKHIAAPRKRLGPTGNFGGSAWS
jgi:hypothetical protein